MTNIVPLYLSAAHKSSGKTTLTIGILNALRKRGYQIQAFKKGPDYIDPIWHSQASQAPCYNLDFNTMKVSEIDELFQSKVTNKQIAIIEGNKGLYDGVDIEGNDSNAALAKHLQAKVVLILDCNGITRGVVPLILGYQQFDADINIAGIILNKLGGTRHEHKLRKVIEHYTDIPVLGAVHKNPLLNIDERHLGLIPSNENEQSQKIIEQITEVVEQQIDLDKLIQLIVPLESINQCQQDNFPEPQLKIAILKDSAFGFYYASDLDAFAKAGANIIKVDALNDSSLPDDIQGLFIGGGFPETQLDKLADNTKLKQDINTKIKNGLPTYAECGGLMYLCRSIQWQDQLAEMVGIIPADVRMQDRPQGRGLIKYSETPNMPWSQHRSQNQSQHLSQNRSLRTSETIYNAHEFHYSKLENIDSSLKFAYNIHRGTGINGQADGIVMYNLLASYAHIRDTEQNHWVERFIQFIKQIYSKEEK